VSTSIQVLPPELVNRIAAGEVVERPASVLKELLENAIDADAQQMEVHVQDGGRTSLKIVDDGTGMAEDDLLLSVESHATSKIKTNEDLETIATFGFRGEALSSIASVSILDILTNTGANETGHRLRVEGGIIRAIDPGVRERGTTITVRNLFFNTPARQKFLRSPQAEMRHINKYFRQIALAWPERSFQLYRGDTSLLKLPATNLRERIATVFSEGVADMLVPVEVTDGPFTLTGFVGKPQLVQSWKGEQFLYINRRFIRNRGINHAVMSGYGPSIDARQTPFYVLFLDVDYDQVDVNVHPTKMEVRFQDDQKIYRFFYHAIQKLLSDPSQTPTSFTVESTQQLASWTPRGNARPAQRSAGTVTMNLPLAPPENPTEQWTQSAASPAEIGQLPEQDPWTPEEQIWQVHNKYLLSQVKSGVVLIDQHNAHEEILYEKALERIHEGAGKSQQLLFPLSIELNFEDVLALGEVTPTLQKIGFDLKLSGERTLVVEGKPPELRQGTEERVLRGFFESYQSNELDGYEGFHRVAALYACHSAIKTGEPLQQEEMRLLVDELFRTSSPHFCPHGRPIVINLSLEEIDKWFLRS
jgi:DNA mismatch repair protein MutL